MGATTYKLFRLGKERRSATRSTSRTHRSGIKIPLYWRVEVRWRNATFPNLATADMASQNFGTCDLDSENKMAARRKNTTKSRAPNDTDILVGSNLRQIRLDRNLTLQTLGAEIGVSHQQLQKYETGANRVSAGMLPVLATALGVDLVDFYHDPNAPAQTQKTKAERVRGECEAVLRRIKSEQQLESVLKILKALSN